MAGLPAVTDQSWKTDVLGAKAALVDFWSDG
jgi:hypothetical protein